MKNLALLYRTLLTEDVLPWWLRHAIDREYGGVFSCIGDDGVVASQDKYVWSQTRALWTFSAAYNRVERNPQWLDVAGRTFDFLRRFGRNPHGDWNYLLTREGELIEGPESIQTDAYAICALVEYAIATGNPEARSIAEQTFERTRARIQAPGS